MNVYIVNGPNLNLLGKREKEHYGNFSLEDLNTFLMKNKPKEAELYFFQSNSEEALIAYIHKLQAKQDKLILNAGAFTHTSIALRDAIIAVQVPMIEVHISNIYKREKFRHHSYLSDIALAQISGLGKYGYVAAIEYFISSKKDS